MYYSRAFLVWGVIILAETIHGILRQLLLVPFVGDFAARQIAVITGMLLIFFITWLFIGWIAVRDTKTLISIGSMWVILTVLFEFGLGVFVLRYSWKRMFEDYDVTSGGLMGFGLLIMLITPFLVKRFSESFT